MNFSLLSESMMRCVVESVDSHAASFVIRLFFSFSFISLSFPHPHSFLPWLTDVISRIKRLLMSLAHTHSKTHPSSLIWSDTCLEDLSFRSNEKKLVRSVCPATRSRWKTEKKDASRNETFEEEGYSWESCRVLHPNQQREIQVFICEGMPGIADFKSQTHQPFTPFWLLITIRLRDWEEGRRRRWL